MTISYKGGVVPFQRTIKGKLPVTETIHPSWSWIEPTIGTREHDVKATLSPDPDQFGEHPDPNRDTVNIESAKGEIIFRDETPSSKRKFVGQEIKESPECRRLGINWHGEAKPPYELGYGWRR